MKKILTLIICITLSSVGLLAQNLVDQFTMSPEEKGDLKVKEFAYSDAVKLYQKAALHEESNLLFLKIAEGYRMLNDPESAEGWYEKGLKEVDTDTTIQDPEYLLHYAEALSSTKKYAESKEWYNKYLVISASHRKTMNRIKGIDSQQQFFKNVSSVSVDKADFNSGFSDFSPTYYNNDIVFISARPHGRAIPLTFNWDQSEYLDIFIVKDSIVKPFSKIHNSRYHEGPAVFYSEGTRMIFTRSQETKKGKVIKNDKGVVNLKLYYSEKVSGDDWSEPVQLSLNSENHSVGHPAISISDDETILYFAADIDGGFGGVDLYMSKWESSDWGTPVNLGPGINTEGDELFPSLNGSQLYFASDGHHGLGGLDLFGTDISTGYNSRIVNLGSPINTSMDDFGMLLQKSGLTGYISSNRDGSLSKDNIYSFTTQKPLISNYLVKGKVLDKYDNKVLSNALVYLIQGDNKIVDSVKTNDSGEYAFSVDEMKEYKLTASKTEYIKGNTSFSTNQSNKEEWEENVLLTPDYAFGAQGFVREKPSLEKISGVTIKVVDNFTNKVLYEGLTDSDGSFGFDLDDVSLKDRVSYQISLEKEGFLGKSVAYNTIIENPGIIALDNELDLSLDKIEIGTDIGKIIDIKPIYFDLGKYAIRPDAATELDKIVKIMNENTTLEIELGSHTDARGRLSGNMRLSDKRAKSSADYIVSQGIDKLRIIGKGYGEAVIINRCKDGVKCSEAEHQTNRRTEFKITKF